MLAQKAAHQTNMRKSGVYCWALYSVDMLSLVSEGVSDSESAPRVGDNDFGDVGIVYICKE